MRHVQFLWNAGIVALIWVTLPVSASTPLPVLDHADVVTMYQGEAATYAAYGIDVIAWGGTPTPEALEAAGERRFFGSVGMVTEWTRYHQFAGDRWEEGIALDINGDPIQPPWLLDFDYKGIPLYWCCTNRPLFREYILHRVRQTIGGGAQGLHIDDHLGSAATVHHGGCFCPDCRELFPQWLSNLDGASLAELGHTVGSDLPKSLLYNAFQLDSARAFMQEIRNYARSLTDQPLPISANSYLSYHPHSTDYDILDFFSSEVPQEGESNWLSDLPIVAYRLAEALDRPLAATASGGDWAHIKASGNDALVRNWIAQAYAAGQFFMAPHRQWCHTPELGTHWYDGPQELFAPLYQWIRSNADRLNGYDTLADIVVLFDMRLYRSGDSLQEVCTALSAAGLNYQFAILGDPILPYPLDSELIRNARAVLVIDKTKLDKDLLELLGSIKVSGKAVYRDVNAAIGNIRPMATIQDPAQRDRYRCFVRQSATSTVIHVVNSQPADAALEEVLTLDLSGLPLPQIAKVCLVSYPDATVHTREISGGQLSLPAPQVWAMIEVGNDLE